MPPPLSHLTVHSTLLFPSCAVSAECVIDSGALGNFVSPTFVQRHGLLSSLRSLPQPLQVEDVAGRALPPVTHFLDVQLSLFSDQRSSHVERITLYVATIGTFDVILGLPWLLHHDRQIDWQQHRLLFSRCPSSCKRPHDCSVCCSTTTTSDSTRARRLCPLEAPGEHDGGAESADHQLPTFTSSTISLVSATTLHEEWSEGIFSGALAVLAPDDKNGPFSTSLGISASSAPSPDVDLSKIPKPLHDLAAVFSKHQAQQLPPHRPYDLTLPLKPDSTPPRGPLYTLSPKEMAVLHEWIEEQLKLGFIRPSSSPASSPILFVRKKDGSLRLCVDYRGLNAITIKNRNPLPRIDQLLDSTRQSRFFSKVDLRSAYNLLRVASGEEWKTAFRTHFGLYETLVMPFGLTNAPPVFQAFITDVLRNHIGKYVAVYLDDILIYSDTLEEHWAHVRAVLHDLLAANLFAKLEKCEFARSEVEFLGFIIGQGTLKMDPSKLDTIRTWPVPKNVKDIQQFLGFCNLYRRFISRFAHHARALTAFTHKNTTFDISPTSPAFASFCTLRDAFLSAPLLRSFDPSLPIQLITDASDFAIAANLHQPDTDNPQNLHPVAFYSRQLTPAETNYTAYDKEMLAVVEGLRQFRHWCNGCASTLTILTDHRNLVYFQQAQRLNDRQARWQELLSEYDFVISHLPGTKNPADPPSRRPDYGSAFFHDHRLQTLLPPSSLSPSSIPSISSLSSPSASAPSPAIPPLALLSFQSPSSDILAQLQDLWPNDQEFADALAQDNPDFSLQDNFYLYRHRLFVPRSLRPTLLRQHHDVPAAGHRGHAVTHELLTRSFDWPGSHRAVRDYVRRCDTCARNKTPRHPPYGQLQPLEVPTRPWQIIGMDHAVDLPMSNGCNSIWIVVDHLSGEAHFIPSLKSDDAMTLSHQFISHIFRLHGLPDRIVSDRGATFVSQFWRRLLHLLDVQASPSTAYHPQTNGKSERTIQTLEAYLRCYVSYHQDDWTRWLPIAEFAFNNSRSASTEQSPFFITRGYHPSFTPGVATTSLVPAAEHMSEHLERTWHEVRAQLQWAKQQMARYYDRNHLPAPQYQPGDLVWLLRRNIPTTRPSDKLDHRRLGPFKVIERVGTSAYRLDLPAQLSSLHPVFPVVLLEPHHGSSTPSSAPPATALAPSLDPAWQSVEQILDQRKIRNQYHYLLRWRDKPSAEDTWRPLSSIPVALEPMLQAFHKRYPRYPLPADLRPPEFTVRRLRDRIILDPPQPPASSSRPQRPQTTPQRRPRPRAPTTPQQQHAPVTTAEAADSGVSIPPWVPATDAAARSPTSTTTNPDDTRVPETLAPSSAPFASAPPNTGRVLRSRTRR